MALIKKIYLTFFHILLKVANILGIIATIILGIVLYVIIFEVPINFFNKYIEERIFHNLVKIEKVYLKWDYNIKKPVLVLNNIKYNSPDNKVSFTFNYLGVSFDITKLITKRKFYPIYINLEGFKLSGVRSKNNTYAFNIEKTKDEVIKDFLNEVNSTSDNNRKEEANTSSIITKKDSPSSMFNVINTSSIEKEGIYNIFMDYRKKYDFLSLLTKVDIDSSIVNFKDEVTAQNFIITFNKISFNYNKTSNKLLVQTDANIEDTSLKKNIAIKGSITADNQRNLFFNYTANDLPPELLLLYANNNITSKIRTAGLYTNANIDGRYQFPYGIRSVNTELTTAAGEIFIKDILLDKVKLNSIKTQINYNTANDKIKIPIFELDLANNSPVKLIALNGGSLNLKKVSLNADLDINNKLYNFNNIKLTVLNYLITGGLNYNKDKIDFAVDTTNTINATEINKLWPKTIASKARDWVINHVTKGTITKAQVAGGFFVAKNKLALSNIGGTALVSNAAVTYVDGMPNAVAPNVRLEFDNKHLSIKYSDGKTGNLQSKTGEVSIYNEFPNKNGFHPVLKVDSQAEGNIVDALLFINSKPLYLLYKTRLDANRFKGDVAGNVTFEYSFTGHKVQNLNIDIIGHNVDFSNAFKGKDVTNVNINLAVKDHKLSAYGNGSYYNMPINLYLDAAWEKNIPYDLKINVESKNVPIAKLDELKVLPAVLKNKITGNADIAIEAQKLKNTNNQVVIATLNLTNAAISSFPYLEYSKAVNVPLNAIINLNFTDDKLTEIKQLTVSGKDIAAQMRIAFNSDDSTNVVIDNFNMAKAANIKGYLYFSNSDFNANIKGDYLNFEWLRKGYEKEEKAAAKTITSDNNALNNNINNENKVKNNENIKDSNNISNTTTKEVTKKPKAYSIKINVKKAESNSTIINNFYVNFDSYNKNLTNLVISGDLNKTDNITIVYDKRAKRVAYNISNLGEALKFLQVSSKIKRGNLNGQINLLQDKQQNILTDGTVLIKSFSVGLIPFSSARFAFTGKNYDFNIMNLYLKGNVVGGALAGNYKSKDHYLTLSGYITPIWSASYLLVNIPLLGDFLKSNFTQTFLSGGAGKNSKAGSSNKGAINITFSVYGKINDLRYSFSAPKEASPSKKDKDINFKLLNPSYYIDTIKGIFDIDATIK